MSTPITLLCRSINWINLYAQFYNSKHFIKFIKINKDKSLKELVKTLTYHSFHIHFYPICEPHFHFLNKIFDIKTLTKDNQIKIFLGKLVKEIYADQNVAELNLFNTLFLGTDLNTSIEFAVKTLSKFVSEPNKVESGEDILDQISDSLSYIVRDIAILVIDELKLNNIVNENGYGTFIEGVINMMIKYNKIMSYNPKKRKRDEYKDSSSSSDGEQISEHDDDQDDNQDDNQDDEHENRHDELDDEQNDEQGDERDDACDDVQDTHRNKRRRLL